MAKSKLTLVNKIMTLRVINIDKSKINKKTSFVEEMAILQELSDAYVVDLRNFMPVGPIIHFGLYHIPPQPKKVKQWTITQRKNVFLV